MFNTDDFEAFRDAYMAFHRGKFETMEQLEVRVGYRCTLQKNHIIRVIRPTTVHIPKIVYYVMDTPPNKRGVPELVIYANGHLVYRIEQPLSHDLEPWWALRSGTNVAEFVYWHPHSDVEFLHEVINSNRLHHELEGSS